MRLCCLADPETLILTWRKRMKQDKSKEQKNPNWQPKPQTPAAPAQPKTPSHQQIPGKKTHGGCGSC